MTNVPLNPLKSKRSTVEPRLDEEEPLLLSTQHTEYLERAHLFRSSPTTSDIIDAIQLGYTILIEGDSLETGINEFEDPPAELAIALTSMTAYLVDIVAIIDDFFLNRTNVHPILCEQILTTTHEVVTNAILWSNLEVDCPDSRSKSLDFCDLIKKRLKDESLAKRMVKMNIHVTTEFVEVAVMSSGKEFNWDKEIKNVTSQFQGLAIIDSLVDKINSENNGRLIRLRFCR